MQIYEVQQGEAQLIKEVTVRTPKILYCLLSPHSSLHYVMEIDFFLALAILAVVLETSC